MGKQTAPPKNKPEFRFKNTGLNPLIVKKPKGMSKVDWRSLSWGYVLEERLLIQRRLAEREYRMAQKQARLARGTD